MASADSLAHDITAGNYTPTIFDRCDSLITHDRKPHVVRFTQFMLFEDPTQAPLREPYLLALQPQLRLPAQSKAALKATTQQAMQAMLTEWESKLATAALPDSKSHIDAIRQGIRQLTSHRVEGARQAWQALGDPLVATTKSAPALSLDGLPSIESSAQKLRSDYDKWLNRERDRLLNLRVQSFATSLWGGAGSAPAVHYTNAQDLVKTLIGIFLPDPFQPFESANAIVALCTTFEQVWEPRGYTRGELISSLGLAPGERLTLEVHSWDKSTRKSEQELAIELEIRSSEKLTQRDALTVAQEWAKQRSTKVDGRGSVTIPGVQLNAGGEVANQTSQSLSRTRESVREQTVEASDTLKVNRRTRIEVSRETGREEKQTRVIENTNRCHSLNCHYFEVMANYMVTTRLVSVRPCVLLPTLRPAMTIDWVLCHEGILIQVLLDRTFLPGFEAAKLLKSQMVLADLQATARVAQTQQLSDSINPHITNILSAYNTLVSARNNVAVAAASCRTRFPPSPVFGDVGFVACVAADTSGIDLVRSVALLALRNNARQALAILAADIAAGRSPAEAAQTFFSVVTPQSFSQVASAQELRQRLLELPLPALIVQALTKNDPLTANDAGLRAAIDGAAAVVAQVPEETPPTAHPGTSNQEQADARVEFDRLLCHLQENWLHYTQAVWFREAADQRLVRILEDYGPVARLFENELLGFHADRAAYPLRDVGAVSGVDLKGLLEDSQEAVNKDQQDPPKPTLITLPTPGVILEAMVGRCNACEDFIEKSRVIELRQQEAKARQEEAEAERREARLAASPPDLADPSPRTPAEIAVKLTTTSGQPSAGT